VPNFEFSHRWTQKAINHEAITQKIDPFCMALKTLKKFPNKIIKYSAMIYAKLNAKNFPEPKTRKCVDHMITQK
jgi:hypothetical protein